MSVEPVLLQPNLCSEVSYISVGGVVRSVELRGDIVKGMPMAAINTSSRKATSDAEIV